LITLPASLRGILFKKNTRFGTLYDRDLAAVPNQLHRFDIILRNDKSGNLLSRVATRHRDVQNQSMRRESTASTSAG
jgi:hypothetical protein